MTFSSEMILPNCPAATMSLAARATVILHNDVLIPHTTRRIDSDSAASPEPARALRVAVAVRDGESDPGLAHGGEDRLAVGDGADGGLLHDDVLSRRRELDDGLWIDESTLAFVTAIWCPCRDSPCEREWARRMTEGPRLSRPAARRGSRAAPTRLVARGDTVVK